MLPGLAGAAPGDVVDVSGLAPAPLPKVSHVGGQLLYSNNPEYIPVVWDGALTLLCRNPVAAGPARCFVYHASAAGRPAKVVVILAPAAGAAQVQVTQRALAAPAADYFGIGRAVQHQWFLAAGGPAAALAVTGPTLLDPALDQWSGGFGDLFHGLWSWRSDRPLVVTVAALPAEVPARSLLGSYALVPREGVFSACPEDFRARGVFAATKRVVAAYGGGGPRFLPVGHLFCAGPPPTQDTPTFDAWVPGRDATPQPPGDTADLGPYLPGNYGVLYRFELVLAGRDPVAVLLNPRGGPIQGAFAASPGLTPGGVMAYGPVPPQRPAVVVGRYQPPAVARVELMPAGAASLPWRVLLVPYPPPEA